MGLVSQQIEWTASGMRPDNACTQYSLTSAALTQGSPHRRTMVKRTVGRGPGGGWVHRKGVGERVRAFLQLPRGWTTDTDSRHIRNTTSICGPQTQTLHPYCYIHMWTTDTTSMLLHPYVNHRHRYYIHTTTSICGPQTQTLHPYYYIHRWTL